jgi:hypothetical protein
MTPDHMVRGDGRSEHALRATIFRDQGHAIDEALKQGVRDALLRHKEPGNLVVIEREGKIVWLSVQELLEK